MSRSNYHEYDGENCWGTIRWRGAVASAIRGKRGQAFLRELAAALDAMPVKELIADALEDETGAVCALGALGKARGMDMKGIDYEWPEQVGKAFGIPHALAAEIEFVNDDDFSLNESSPEQRWREVRAWVAQQIQPPPDGSTTELRKE